MDIAKLPFNNLVGLGRCKGKPNGIFEILGDKKYHNHLGTIHASAMYSLAEASSGQFLLNRSGLDPEDVVPLLRRSDIKYRKPADGYVYSTGHCEEEDWQQFLDTFHRRGRAIVSIQVGILNLEDVVVATGNFDWFVSTRS